MIATETVKNRSAELLMAMIAEEEQLIRDRREAVAHYRSLLRNLLAGQNYKGQEYRVTFRPGFYKAIPCKRIGMGLVFKRVRLEPYMSVKPIAKLEAVR